MLFEAKVGRGKLVVCSVDLSNNEGRPVAAQLKNSILGYMSSDNFHPAGEVNAEIILELFEKKDREAWKSFVNHRP